MTMVIDLSTPEKFKQFEQAYTKALIQHLQDPTKPMDLKVVAEEAGAAEAVKTEPKV